MPWATSTKGVSQSVIRGTAISATFNTTASSNCPAYQVATLPNTASSSGRMPAVSGTRSLEWWPVGSGWRGARGVINATNSKARFPALSKLSTGRRTLTYGDVVIECVHTHCIVVRRRMQHPHKGSFVWYVAINYGAVTYNFSICRVLR